VPATEERDQGQGVVDVAAFVLVAIVVAVVEFDELRREAANVLARPKDHARFREVMGRYHTELRTILEQHGGTVEKSVGDAAMAVFGR
jgi:class 3 adenylate cyclase